MHVSTPASEPHDHAGHAHVHDHGRDHGRDHGHVHVAREAVAFVPGFSLLRLSAAERLAGAAAIAALLWAGVWWALH